MDMKDQIPEPIERYRITAGPMATEPHDRHGAFKVPLDRLDCKDDYGHAQIIVNHGEMEGADGWEHASVTVEKGGPITPTWDVMQAVKDLFWEPEERVVQYHPPESEYVSCHDQVLHLWRPTGEDVPSPPSHLVGPKLTTS